MLSFARTLRDMKAPADSGECHDRYIAQQALDRHE